MAIAKWKFSVLAATLGFSSALNAQSSDPAQSPLMCVEDVVPQVPDRACPDLSMVVEITKEPIEAYFPPEELSYWKARKYRMPYCRSQEILKRETAAPGTFTAGTMQVTAMRLGATTRHAEKVNAIYQASRTYGVPALVLTGALNQESLFAELGVSDDGNNFSCGVAQINLYEWCNWATRVGQAKKTEIGWPAQSHRCNPDDRLWIKPFFDLARKKKPEASHLDTSLFTSITLDQVISQLPPADRATQELRYAIAKSFLNNCANPKNAIQAKANELADLYNTFVPAGLKQAQRAAAPVTNSCQQQGATGAQPLHVGWLLAVGAYNAGPRVVDAMITARDFNSAQLADKATFENFTPMNLVESLFWAGKFNAATDGMTIKTRNGNSSEMKWYKLCVVQRHVSRIVEHVTRPEATPITKSMEGEFGPCTATERDPVTKAIVKSGVPELRQKTDGRVPKI